MQTQSGKTFLLPLWLMILLLTSTHPTLACATATDRSDNISQQVQIAQETALIVWDAAHQTEHFIRQATFNSRSKDFGFLVPTPTMPTLAETNKLAFSTLQNFLKPEERTETITRYRFNSWLFPQAFPNDPDSPPLASAAMPMSEGFSTKVGASVEVLHEQQVAGYDAVVLEADNVTALKDWLQDHGYVSRPALMDWIAPYVQAHWKITAFKIAKGMPDVQSVSSAVVRMSFSTPQPFFPYREPADQRKQREEVYSPRLLRVFFLSDTRMEGTFGQQGADKWLANTPWANTLSETQKNELLPHLNLSSNSLPATLWMTSFEDIASIRQGTEDVYFQRSATQEKVVPAPIIHHKTVDVKIPVEPFAFVALVIFLQLGWISWGKRNSLMLKPRKARLP